MNGEILVVGGAASSTTFLTDVLVSADGGKTFQTRTANYGGPGEIQASNTLFSQECVVRP